MEPLTEEEDRRLWREAIGPVGGDYDWDYMILNRRRVSRTEYEHASALMKKSTAPIVPPRKRQVELIVDGIEQTAVLDVDQAEKWDAEVERYEKQKSSLVLVSNKQQREYRLREAAREHAANKRRIAGLLSKWEQALKE